MNKPITFDDLTDFLRSEGIEPTLVPNRNYWFLRTHGGDYYKEFFLKGFVAIG